MNKLDPFLRRLVDSQKPVTGGLHPFDGVKPTKETKPVKPTKEVKPTKPVKKPKDETPDRMRFLTTCALPEYETGIKK